MLRLSIKRRLHRRHDSGAAAADAEFAAVREEVLRKHGWACVDCGWKSQASGALQVHHLNDDHSDNSLENLVPKCAADHAYHHIGCDAPSPGGHQGLASQMRIAYAPWIRARDMNLLQMALAAAWNDPRLGSAAKAIYALLMTATRVVHDGVGTHHAKDFAAALEQMSQEQYEQRRVDDFRIVFHPDLLQTWAKRWKEDYPLLPPSGWSTVINPDVLAAEAE